MFARCHFSRLREFVIEFDFVCKRGLSPEDIGLAYNQPPEEEVISGIFSEG